MEKNGKNGKKWKKWKKMAINGKKMAKKIWSTSFKILETTLVYCKWVYLFWEYWEGRVLFSIYLR